jgi:hypothetical protein
MRAQNSSPPSPHANAIWCTLLIYLQLGMKLMHVHHIVTFKQSMYICTYINFCTTKCAESKTEFHKWLFKAFSTSNFGKFIEQKRKHLDCQIIHGGDIAAFEKWVACPRFVSIKVLSDMGVVTIFLHWGSIFMKQAWAIGFTILEWSKWLILSLLQCDQTHNQSWGGGELHRHWLTQSMCARVE